MDPLPRQSESSSLADCQPLDLVQWRIDPDASAPAEPIDEGQVDRWLREGTARVVKEGARRTVYRIDLPHRRLFVKHFRTRSWGELCRRAFSGSAAVREFSRAGELARRQIPAIRPVAVGHAAGPGLVWNDFLVTEAIPGACALDDYVDRVLPTYAHQQRALLRRKLAVALARFCAQAHEKGVVHRDLHLGNVVVRLDPTLVQTGNHRLPRLHLVDVPDVDFGHPLTWRRSREALMMLCASWGARASHLDRWRFWRAYCAARPRLVMPPPRKAAAEINRRSQARMLRVAAARDKRAFRDNRDYYSLRSANFAGFAVRGLPKAAWAEMLEDPESLMRHSTHRAVKLSHTSVVVEADLPFAGQHITVAYKRTRHRCWWKVLAGWFRPNRALVAWQLGHALAARGIPTAQPIAVCRQRGWSLAPSSYLLTRWLPGATNLHSFAWDLAERCEDERRRRSRQCAASLGALAGRLHAWKISHRDLKGCNLVVVQQPEGMDCYLIDLDGARLARSLPRRVAVSNIARLATSMLAHEWVSRGDRLRFLRAYLLARGLDPQQWKPWWEAVMLESCRQVRQRMKAGKALV